jgi:hypothetical protein
MIALAGRGTPYPETTMLPSRFSCREPAARTAPVLVLVSFAAVRGSPQRTGLGRSSRSQTTLTCHERTYTDLESVLGASPQEFESLILRQRSSAAGTCSRYFFRGGKCGLPEWAFSAAAAASAPAAAEASCGVIQASIGPRAARHTLPW